MDSFNCVFCIRVYTMLNYELYVISIRKTHNPMLSCLGHVQLHFNFRISIKIVCYTQTVVIFVNREEKRFVFLEHKCHLSPSSGHMG